MYPGPLAMVVAGIIIGNKGTREAMSDTTKDYVNKFWELIDEMLNALLFLLIGFEMIILSFDNKVILIGLIAIIVSLTGRYISVFIPTLFMSYKKTFDRTMLPILTWGGLTRWYFRGTCTFFAQRRFQKYHRFDYLYHCSVQYPGTGTDDWETGQEIKTCRE